MVRTVLVPAPEPYLAGQSLIPCKRHQSLAAGHSQIRRGAVDVHGSRAIDDSDDRRIAGYYPSLEIEIQRIDLRMRGGQGG